MNSYSILIVDDEENIREALREALEGYGYNLATAENSEKALQLLQVKQFHLVLLDLILADQNGMQLLRQIKKKSPQTEVVMITAYGTVETAVEALREGAYDYITKPIQLKRLRSYVQRILRATQLEEENKRLRRQLRQEQEYQSIVGCSAALMEILDLLDQVAPTDVPVLIQGETGTGKELIARAIHQRSIRAHGPFVTMNCGALPSELFESELFGYEKGAFTGAQNRKKGRYEMADGGTLFLDEVAEMALSSQVDFLRLLEEGRFHRLGSTEAQSVDVRVIAATNKELLKLCNEGRFREDLYFRLNVVRIDVPALRERKEDIPLLVEHFLEEFSEKYGRPHLKIAQSALDAMMSYDWPGNIRELKNSLERSVVLCRGNEIRADSFPFCRSFEEKQKNGEHERPLQGNYPMDWTLEQIERHHIEKVLAHFNGHRRQTAKALGISERDLYYKIKKLGL